MKNKNQNYMQFLEEAAGANAYNAISSYSNPAKDIINWRGKNGKNIDTTIASSDLDSIIEKIVGPKGKKKDPSQFAEDYGFNNDALDDLLENDHGYGCENLEESWEYDVLNELESDANDIVDPLTGLEEDANDNDDVLADLLESVGLDPEDDEDDDDYDLNESNFEDDDMTELMELGDPDDDDDFDDSDDLSESYDPEDDDEYDDELELSESSPISALEENYSDINSLSNLIREMDELENELDSSINYDEYDFVEESDTISDEEVNELLNEMRGGCMCVKKCTCGKLKSNMDEEDEDDEDMEYEEEDDDEYDEDEDDEDEYDED